MKRILPGCILVLIVTMFASAQNYPTVSIHDLQFVPADSLIACDSVGAANGQTSTRWSLQTAAYYKTHTGGVIDTVEIVGQVIVPPKLIQYTGPPFSGNYGLGRGGYNIILRDTAAGDGSWSSIFVRPAANTDTVALYSAGYLGLNPGDVIRLRGYVDEFPPSYTVSYTEFVPICSPFIQTATMTQCVEVLGHKPMPSPIEVEAGMFMKGTYGNGPVKFSTGEPLEDCYVQLTNLTVAGVVNTTNGTFAMVDSKGNEISSMDGSIWFTNREWRGPTSTYALPLIGQVIDTIRGYIATNSGGDAGRGYRIYPVFKQDIVYGKIHPAINTHRRNPVALTSTDTAVISVRAFKQQGGEGVKTVILYYSLNNGSWIPDTMTGPATDSTWTAKIPTQSLNTFVKYFCLAADTSGRSSIYASAAGGTSSSDTSQGFFFYTVLNRSLTIHDVQYTPYANGYSGLLGDIITINGVVTADTSDLSLTSTGTTPWYIQNGNAPWNGIWVTGIDTLLSPIHKGDSVSVTGTVQEYLNGTAGSVGRVTRIGNASAVSILASGKAVPDPVVLATGALNASNGSLSAEPYEGMLVRFNTVTVTDTAPTFSDATEYTINDGSGPVIVRAADGRSRYSNVKGDAAYGKTILNKGDKFSYIQGIIYFSYNQYKFVPRGNGDFGTYTAGVLREGSIIPAKFALSQNYPNPFNPSTKIEYDLAKSGVVSLTIYNILGQEVALLVNGTYIAGHYSIQFNASRLSSGMYLYRLQSASGVLVKKMLLVK